MIVSVSLDDRVEVKGLEAEVVDAEHAYLYAMKRVRDQQLTLQAKVDGLFEKYGLKKEEFQFDLNKLEFVKCASPSSPTTTE
jgi:hypothetical protein